MLVTIINWLIDLLYLIAVTALAILPESPFQFDDLSWGPFGQFIGYVFPVSTLFLHMATIITAITIYYSTRWLLRLIKTIR